MPGASLERAPTGLNWTLLPVGAGVLLFALVPALLPTYQVSVATQVLIFAMLAMSVDILAGYAGRTPLGHGALFGVSTYVTVYWVTVAGGSP